MNLAPIKMILPGPIKGVISRYHRYRLKGQYPSFLLLNVTERCNCRCSMCRIWDKKDLRELTFEDYNRFFQDPLWKKIHILSLTGGEPFLRKDLKEIILSATRHLKNLRRISLPSNGILTENMVETTKQILTGIPKHIVFKIGVSIDGPAEIHDRMRGVPGAFEKATNTIRRLKSFTESNFEVGILTLLTEQNADQLKDIHYLLTSLTRSITWTLATKSDFFENREKQKTLYSSETIRKILTFIDDILIPSFPEKAYLYSKYKDHLIKNKRSYPCLAGYRSAYLDTEGNLLPCHYIGKHFSFGNFLKSEESLEKMWFSSKSHDIRKKLQYQTYCRNCSNNCDFRNLIQEDFWNFFLYLILHPLITRNALFNGKSKKNSRKTTNKQSQ